MECHMEQVLYRDQRTIKTRYLDSSKPHRRLSCRPCQSDRLTPEPQRFNLSLPSNHHQVSSSSNYDGPFSIQGGQSTGSLDNCHNQYSLKFKRLNRTDGKCGGCEDGMRSRISERRKRGGMTTWAKKLQNVLLLSTCLTILTLPHTHARPGTMYSDEGFWMNPCDSNFKSSGKPPSEINVTNVNYAIISANTALISANNLMEAFVNATNKTGFNPKLVVQTYSWLPQLPKINDTEFQQHLSSLDWQESLLSLFTNLQKISVPLEQMEIDYTKTKNDLTEQLKGTKGLVRNALCDLHESIIDNNLTVTEKVTRDIMPSNIRDAGTSESSAMLRDSIILRELVIVLEYTKAVCEYFKERTGGNNS